MLGKYIKMSYFHPLFGGLSKDRWRRGDPDPPPALPIDPPLPTSYTCILLWRSPMDTCISYRYFFFNCMFYQLLGVQHSCSSTQSWDSVLPSIVETRDQNSRGWPLPFSKRNLGSFCAYRGKKSYTPTAVGKLWITPGVRCTKHASS